MLILLAKTAAAWQTTPMSWRRKSEKLKLLRDQAFARQGGACYWCDRVMLRPSDKVPANHGFACTAEHLVPRALGGRDDILNIVAACRRCNNGRGLGEGVVVSC
jgi:5-methylcytosine-specific restriction endonuclease McrA